MRGRSFHSHSSCCLSGAHLQNLMKRKKWLRMKFHQRQSHSWCCLASAHSQASQNNHPTRRQHISCHSQAQLRTGADHAHLRRGGAGCQHMLMSCCLHHMQNFADAANPEKQRSPAAAATAAAAAATATASLMACWMAATAAAATTLITTLTH